MEGKEFQRLKMINTEIKFRFYKMKYIKWRGSLNNSQMSMKENLMKWKT